MPARVDALDHDEQPGPDRAVVGLPAEVEAELEELLLRGRETLLVLVAGQPRREVEIIQIVPCESNDTHRRRTMERIRCGTPRTGTVSRSMFVKICGITNEDDALLSVAMGADAVGFNFVAGSPRQIAAQVAYDITRRLPAGDPDRRRVPRRTPERVVELAHKSGVKAVQLHGRETPGAVHRGRQADPWVIKAFSAGDPNLPRADQYGTDMIMIDGAEPGLRQGVRLVARRRCAGCDAS